ncbi:MAG: hypothetical protein ACD_76C00036G0003 [uncultured bacterium]|nr:MAG: hypothetical protein ACD_76C00036G0003 [uncultured bacterium]HBD05365.1 hypothetical protein [Candidatus Uhrbacteria bacterium]
MKHIINNNRRGFASLATVVVIFFTALLLAISIQFIGLGQIQLGFSNVLSVQSQTLSDGCLSEALIRLKENQSYTGGTVTVGNDSCTIVVTGSGLTRTINTTGIVNNIIERRIEANITFVGSRPTIDSWEELTN